MIKLQFEGDTIEDVNAQARAYVAALAPTLYLIALRAPFPRDASGGRPGLIPAIKALREATPGLSLADAKARVDTMDADRAYTIRQHLTSGQRAILLAVGFAVLSA